MPTVYPSDYDALTSGSLGATKSNVEPIVTPSQQVDGLEWNTLAGAARQLELKVGDGSAVLSRYGDPDLNNIREIMEFMSWRCDRAGMSEHFLFNSWTTALVDDIGAVGAFAQVGGGIGVGQIACAAAVATGFAQATDHFAQRSSYFRCRWQMATLPVGVGDFLQCGLIRDGTHYIKVYSQLGGGGWTPWYFEVNNGGVVAGQALAAAPSMNKWITFEIITTPIGASLVYLRGDATEEEKIDLVNAPESAYCHPAVLATSAAGGELLNCDLIACRDTRAL